MNYFSHIFISALATQVGDWLAKRAGTVQKDSVPLSLLGSTVPQNLGILISTRSAQTRESVIAIRENVHAFLVTKARLVDVKLAQVIVLDMERVNS